MMEIHDITFIVELELVIAIKNNHIWSHLSNSKHVTIIWKCFHLYCVEKRIYFSVK